MGADSLTKERLTDRRTVLLLYPMPCEFLEEHRTHRVYTSVVVTTGKDVMPRSTGRYKGGKGCGWEPGAVEKTQVKKTGDEND